MKTFFKDVEEGKFYKRKIEVSKFNSKTMKKSLVNQSSSVVVKNGNHKIGIGNWLLNHHLFKFNSYFSKFVAYTSAFEKRDFSQKQ